MTYEPLESRRLFASLTLITHGYDSDTTGWVSTAATDIQGRDGGTSASSIYTISVAAKSGKLRVTNFAADSGQKDWETTTKGDLILKLDWSSVSTGTYTTQAVAAVVDGYLQVAHGDVPPLAELPMHLIGHSRGASLMTALAQDLGQSGIWVAQQTNLDPHPVDGKDDFLGVSFGDQPMATYDNVEFADTYWRTDGNPDNFDFDGESVAGSLNNELTVVQDNFIASAHEAVTAYYVGTINTSTLDGGDHPVLPVWYVGTKTAPARNATGFAFSTLAGGGQLSQPSSGVDAALGGRGKRTAAGEDGAQWANAFGLNTRHVTTVAAGEQLTTRFYVADRDSPARVDVYADTDANPYDSGATLLTGKTFASNALGTGRLNVPTAALNAGSYYLATKATDAAGHVRWDYTTYKVNVAAADFASLTAGILNVSGTAGADKISLSQNASTISVTRNGATQTFAAGGVHAINVLAGAGNDTIDASGMSDAIYVNAGPGFDSVVGGAGNDTLSGGAQSNTLIGGLGDDVLNGSAGNDMLEGDGGYDRLYGNGGLDTYSGGSNADRLFGGDDADLMYGGAGNDKIYGNGGNDTIIGGQGVDIVNGGTGTNTADNDPLDLRTDIQALTNL